MNGLCGMRGRVGGEYEGKKKAAGVQCSQVKVIRKIRSKRRRWPSLNGTPVCLANVGTITDPLLTSA